MNAPAKKTRTEALTSSESQDWNTPESFLDRVRQAAPIALDPASNATSKTTALVELYGPGISPILRHDVHADCLAGGDGLKADWAALTQGLGLAFCNPVYGRELPLWTTCMRQWGAMGVPIIALLPSRTDAGWMHRDVFGSADVGLFWRGRIQFERDGKPGKTGSTIPSFVALWSKDPAIQERFIDAFKDAGEVVMLGTGQP